MNSQEQDSWAEEWYVWVGPPLIVLAAVFWLVFHGGHKQPPAGGPPAGQHPLNAAPGTTTEPGVTANDPLGQYLALVRAHQPVVTLIPRQDMVDGKTFDVPSVDMKGNFVGGEATDLMSIAMDVAKNGTREPVPGVQEWTLKTATAPVSGATYMEVDFFNAKSGVVPNAAVNMRDWDLARLCPPLAQAPPDQWTDDERQYVHYLTRRTMGFDGTEVGFAALWAAYASNFALWHGDKHAVPAAAYYALAAAHFDQHLAAGGPADRRAAAVTYMVAGELHRLLGQLDAARSAFTEAEKHAADMQEPERKVLAFEQGLIAKGDLGLQRLPDNGRRPPPVGWYIDYLFDAINGDLDVERAQWAALTTPDAICTAINQRIAERRAGQ